jgi:hypothetical protein
MTNRRSKRTGPSSDGAFIAFLLGDEPKYSQYIQNRLAIVSVAELAGRAPTICSQL